VTGQEGGDIMAPLSGSFVPQPGWRAEMGAGNQPGETWSLFMNGNGTGAYFWLTNFWSASKPTGPLSIAVTNGTFSFDSWGNVDWTDNRRAAGQEVAQWMEAHCG
jgi:hypothetical protein